MGSCSLLWGIFPTQGLSPGLPEPRFPTLQADFLPAEPQGKPKNNGVGSLSLLQQIFPTQELNRDLLHCWRILYQLRQGRPKRCIDSYFYLLTLLSHCIFNFKDCLILWGAISHKWNEIIWKSWKLYENTHVFFGIFLKWIILVFSITNGRSFQANSFNIGSSDHA